jgi:sulfite exporter TauE/SafE
MNLFFPMLLTGLVTSVHCVGMCGNMVLAYAIKDDSSGSFLERMKPHFAYHGAKIASYVLVGLVLGSIGAVLNLAGIRGWASVAAGLFMVFLGLQMTGRFPWLMRFSPRPPKFLMTAIMKLRRKANADEAAGESTLATPLMFGALTGLMPCGPLQGAQLAAAATGSAAGGAVAMLGFGLGTMPLMLGYGAIAGALSGKFKQRMMVFAALIVLVLGLVMLDRGAMLLGSPVTFQSIKTAAIGAVTGGGATADTSGYKTAADGAVLVPLTIKNTQFVPAQLAIPAGKAVRLVVDRQEDNSCSSQIAVPQLGVVKDLKAFGTTQVDLPPTKGGTYTLTCGMGMMSGQLVVGGAGGGNASAGTPTAAIASAVSDLGLLPMLGVVALVGLGATWYVRRRRQPAAAKADKPKARTAKARTANAGTSKSGASKSRDTRHAEPAGFLGFNKNELITIAAAIAVAILAGFTIGGGLR